MLGRNFIKKKKRTHIYNSTILWKQNDSGFSFDCSPQNSVHFKKDRSKRVFSHNTNDSNGVHSLAVTSTPLLPLFVSSRGPGGHLRLAIPSRNLCCVVRFGGSRKEAEAAREIFFFFFPHHPLQWVAQWQRTKPFLALTSFLDALSERSCAVADGWLGLFLSESSLLTRSLGRVHEGVQSFADGGHRRFLLQFLSVLFAFQNV